MKSQRQQYIDIIMYGDENNEQQLEFLESLTLKELESMANEITDPDEDDNDL